MKSSKWTRQNKTRGRQGGEAVIKTVAVSILLVIVINFLTDWYDSFSDRFGLDLYYVVLTLGFTGSVIYWGALKYSRPNEMGRVTKISYEDADFTFRKLFKDRGLVFIRRKSEDGYFVYAFTGRDISLSIFPYNSELSAFGRPDRPDHQRQTYTDTLLQIPNLHDKNRPFAEELALKIDQTVAQHLDQQKKAG